MRTEDGYVIQQCLDGKPGAFGFLVEKYKKGVYALAYSEIRNFHDAQDITQEVFIKAFQNLHTLKRWDNFMGWLCRITLNTCKNWIRSASRRPDSEYMEDQEQSRLDHSAIEFYNDDMVNESVREALDSLPETYRQVLSLRYFGGMTVSEISDFLSVSRRTIDRRISEAQAKLREEIPAMLDIAKGRYDLPSGFTFHIVEIVKGIRINPISPIKAVPLGLSLAIGIIAGFLSIGTHLNLFEATISTFLNSASKPKILDVGEYPVDVMDIAKMPNMSNGWGSVVPSLQNALFMAPQAEGGTWTKKADMPIARHYHSAGVVNEKIYIIGGCSPLDWVVSVDEYDPVSDEWRTKKANMPTIRGGFSVGIVDGKIYAIGGVNNLGANHNDIFLSAVEEYDPVADKWTKKADMPTARCNLSVSVVNGKIYAIGGGEENRWSPAVEEYDPIADKWAKKADMPVAREAFSSVVNGKIYVIGGEIEGNRWSPAVEEYDPVADKWAKKADMPVARAVFSASVVNGEIYAIGGMDINGNIASTVEKYDPATDKWTKKTDMPTARYLLTTSVVNGKIYAIGGDNENNGNTNILSAVEEYDPGIAGQSINFKGKLPTTWGETKTALNR